MNEIAGAGYLMWRLPHPRPCLFQHPILQRPFGKRFLEAARRTTQVYVHCRGGLGCHIDCQPLHTGYQKLLTTCNRGSRRSLHGGTRPARTIRSFALAAYCRHVSRLMSRTIASALSLKTFNFCLISVPLVHYDDPEILRYESPYFILMVPTSNGI